jgi:hypothetical protein
MSFFITKAQKAALQRLGYSEDQIREMKPEDAHRALGPGHHWHLKRNRKFSRAAASFLASSALRQMT